VIELTFQATGNSGRDEGGTPTITGQPREIRRQLRRGDTLPGQVDVGDGVAPAGAPRVEEVLQFDGVDTGFRVGRLAALAVARRHVRSGRRRRRGSHQGALRHDTTALEASHTMTLLRRSTDTRRCARAGVRRRSRPLATPPRQTKSSRPPETPPACGACFRRWRFTRSVVARALSRDPLCCLARPTSATCRSSWKPSAADVPEVNHTTDRNGVAKSKQERKIKRCLFDRVAIATLFSVNRKRASRRKPEMGRRQRHLLV